jgi:hypothetical protein
MLVEKFNYKISELITSDAKVTTTSKSKLNKNQSNQNMDN